MHDWQIVWHTASNSLCSLLQSFFSLFFHFCLCGGWHLWFCGGTFSKDLVLKTSTSQEPEVPYQHSLSFHQGQLSFSQQLSVFHVWHTSSSSLCSLLQSFFSLSYFNLPTFMNSLLNFVWSKFLFPFLAGSCIKGLKLLVSVSGEVTIFYAYNV